MGFLHVFQELPRAFKETYQGPGHEVRLMLCNRATRDITTVGPACCILGAFWIVFRMRWLYFDVFWGVLIVFELSLCWFKQGSRQL